MLPSHICKCWCKRLYNMRTASTLANQAAKRRKRASGAAQAPEQLEQVQFVYTTAHMELVAQSNHVCASRARKQTSRHALRCAR